MKKQLLFVTYQNEAQDEGLTYAIDLAKTLEEGITILLINKKKLEQRFEDIMAAAAFAEEGEQETAREIERGNNGGSHDKQTRVMLEQCKSSGIEANLQTAQDGIVGAISGFLKNKTAVDMVLLSPSITKNGNMSARELQRLVKTALRPVVTIAKQELQHA
ncbi:MAG: hypothetical protein NTW44_02470 [Nitrospirae bacterium]|nr:hypothetical protein [Nitrospirota bacterium]